MLKWRTECQHLTKTIDQIVQILVEEVGIEKAVRIADRIRKEVQGNQSATQTFHTLYGAAERRRNFVKQNQALTKAEL